ncbi:hypothetical protein SLEP1_g12646 [Rubroshorea leprosula]|uniref:RNase H type-1 domain-containing protein n=1 Tax=Rubroshorea leprosula TaxID=152421 RepID=A0AAV5IND2_9ROSI|nr:hypothetical protein SLEP1_g12646 [Rubroshorea leprosula]
MDALGRSCARLRVSTTTPCHGCGIDTANSCKAHLLSIPCHACPRPCSCLRTHGVVAVGLCHDGLDVGPRTHASGHAAQRDKMGKPKKFDWTGNCQTTFDKLKAYFSSSPLLTKAEEECTFGQEKPSSEIETWTLYVDGSSNSKGLRAGAILTRPGDFQSEHALKFNFEAMSKMAEYEALLLGLHWATELKVKRNGNQYRSGSSQLDRPNWSLPLRCNCPNGQTRGDEAAEKGVLCLMGLSNYELNCQSFKIGDLVLRRIGLTRFETYFSKLVPNWKGPYTVTKISHPVAYILQDPEGKKVPKVWNVNNLKKFYLESFPFHYCLSQFRSLQNCLQTNHFYKDEQSKELFSRLIWLVSNFAPFVIHQHELKTEVRRKNGSTFTVPVPFQCNFRMEVSSTALPIFFHFSLLISECDFCHIHNRILQLHLLLVVGEGCNCYWELVEIDDILESAGLQKLCHMLFNRVVNFEL